MYVGIDRCLITINKCRLTGKNIIRKSLSIKSKYFGKDN